MIDENRKLTVVDENGQEIEMEIILTFHENDKDYVAYFNPNDENEESEIYVSIYDGDGHLFSIESDEEWQMVEEVINCYFEDLKEEK